MSTLGIFGTLNMATRSLSTQRVGTEIAGHNLANVNNPGYARQRVSIESSLAIPTELGPQGTGAEAVSIRQIRDGLIDRQLLTQTSTTSFWETQQKALQYAQADLGQVIDRQASSPEGLAATGSVGGQHGIAEAMTDFFSSLKGLATSSSTQDVDSQRANVLAKASSLATQLNSVDSQLTTLNTSLNSSLTAEVKDTNRLIADIAKLNQQIVAAEIGIGGAANDLRDVRQQRLEELASHLNFSTTELPSGVIDLSIDGVQMNAGANVLQSLETYDPGTGQLLLRTSDPTSGATTPITLTGGAMQGTLEVRDGAVATLRQEVNNLASSLIAAVNTQHALGFNATGNPGAAFFSGTNASSIRLALATGSDLAAAGAPGASLDNANAVRLAALADRSDIAGLGGLRFNQRYNQSVTDLGQALSTANDRLNNEDIIQTMLERQRDSISGVSIDEEMTDLIKYQRAFEASARLVSVLDEMLATLVNLGR